jgi:hypothetical protein
VTTHVEADISLPIGAGPDGHVALTIDIPDLSALTDRDGRYLLALVDKLAALAPHSDSVPATRKLHRAIGERAA